MLPEETTRCKEFVEKSEKENEGNDPNENLGASE